MDFLQSKKSNPQSLLSTPSDHHRWHQMEIAVAASVVYVSPRVSQCQCGIKGVPSALVLCVKAVTSQARFTISVLVCHALILANYCRCIFTHEVPLMEMSCGKGSPFSILEHPDHHVLSANGFAGQAPGVPFYRSDIWWQCFSAAVRESLSIGIIAAFGIYKCCTLLSISECYYIPCFTIHSSLLCSSSMIIMR